jgi:HEAT repeat protein
VDDIEPARPGKLARAGRADPLGRQRAVALAGHAGDEPAAREALEDTEPALRAIALGALARMGSLTRDDLVLATRDSSPVVRRRAAETAARAHLTRSTDVDDAVRSLLDDPDASVVEVAAFAVGERHAERRGDPDTVASTVEALATLVRDHEESLVREAAVAAIGAIADERGLPAILHALGDRATVRRRAVIALAPFDGPEVDAALRRAASDRDWQVRQAAEDQLDVS